MRELILKDEQETIALGQEIGASLKKGNVVGLTGDLGAGKTCLTKGIALGLGIHEAITSPTFTIIHEYGGGRLPLYHFDVYRLSGSEEMFELGYDEYFYGDGVCVVEWADMIFDLLPEGTLLIHLNASDGPGRICRLERK